MSQLLKEYSSYIYSIQHPTDLYQEHLQQVILTHCILMSVFHFKVLERVKNITSMNCILNYMFVQCTAHLSGN